MATPSLIADLDEITLWIDRVQTILGNFDTKLSVPVTRWDPPPVAGLAPLAQPACIRPMDGGAKGTSIGDLVTTLRATRDWLNGVNALLKRLPPGSPIP